MGLEGITQYMYFASILAIGTGQQDMSLYVLIPVLVISKITLPPCLFVQPIAAHDFTIYLFDTHTSFYATFQESWCVEHYSL